MQNKNRIKKSLIYIFQININENRKDKYNIGFKE